MAQDISGWKTFLSATMVNTGGYFLLQGFAFIRFTNKESAQNAVQMHDATFVSWLTTQFVHLVLSEGAAMNCLEVSGLVYFRDHIYLRFLLS